MSRHSPYDQCHLIPTASFHLRRAQHHCVLLKFHTARGKPTTANLSVAWQLRRMWQRPLHLAASHVKLLRATAILPHFTYGTLASSDCLDLFTLFLIMRSYLPQCQSRCRKMYGIAAQSGCLRKKHSSKQHNKERRSGKALTFGLR